MTWRLAGVDRLELSGRFWRILAPRWAFAPLSGEGAARAGGRWNQPGQHALYLSDGHATAIAEYQQNLPRPGTLTAYDVKAEAILDLADPGIRQALNVDDGFVRQPWKHVRDVERQRPRSWDFAAEAAAAGWQGVRAPSVQGEGRNLVLWRWNAESGATVRHLDPLADLPENQRSWRR